MVHLIRVIKDISPEATGTLTDPNILVRILENQEKTLIWVAI